MLLPVERRHDDPFRADEASPAGDARPVRGVERAVPARPLKRSKSEDPAYVVRVHRGPRDEPEEEPEPAETPPEEAEAPARSERGESPVATATASVWPKRGVWAYRAEASRRLANEPPTSEGR